jgi:uncharacterized SAM-binding protein YcdF (DUF218 family)
MFADIINKLKTVGFDGLATLLLSNLIIITTLGLTPLAILIYVARIATTAPKWISGQFWILVPGACLRNNQPSTEFKRRLERAYQLFEELPGNKIVILGGVVGSNTISEAEAGRTYLLHRGVPESHILMEQHSGNTLDNFLFAKAEKPQVGQTNTVIVSNRYHLARCGVMANSLQIEHQLCAAEERLCWSPLNLLRMLKEAYRLHWYWCDIYWTRVTGNEKR